MREGKKKVMVYRRPKPFIRWQSEDDDSLLDPRFEAMGTGGVNVKSSDPIERALEEVA